MVKRTDRVVLDTNIIISGTVYKGKPRDLFQMVLDGEIEAVTSQVLIAECVEVYNKKFPLSPDEIKFIERKIRRKFILIQPRKTINKLIDEPDNRVLEAAVEGKCDYIITGDRDLLRLKVFKRVKIITVSEFLNKDILSLAGKFKPKNKKSILKTREELERKYKRV